MIVFIDEEDVAFEVRVALSGAVSAVLRCLTFESSAGSVWFVSAVVSKLTT